jgi:hypothetical protein
VTAPRHEGVRGLDVAMDDAFGVRASSASAISVPKSISSSISRCYPMMRCFNVTPSRNSIAMKDRPS